MGRVPDSDSQEAVVRPDMNIESTNADAFRDVLLKASDHNHSDLVVDLSRIDTIDSVGLGVFIAIYNTLTKKEKKLKVINASRRILSLFQIMGLTRRFKVEGRASHPNGTGKSVDN
jgi:anti-sigma B factor antagonist